MKYLLILLLVAPLTASAASPESFYSLLKSFGLTAERGTKFEAGACAREVAQCFEALGSLGILKIGSSNLEMADDLSKQAVARLEASIQIPEGKVNVRTVRDRSIKNTLEVLVAEVTEKPRLSPDPITTMAIVVKLGNMPGGKYANTGLATILDIVEVLQHDQLSVKVLNPAVFKDVTDNLLVLAVSKLLVENTSASIQRLKAVIAERKLLSEAFEPAAIAEITDQNISDVADALSQVDTNLVRAGVRRNMFERLGYAFSMFQKKVGNSLSVASYTRLLTSLDKSMFEALAGTPKDALLFDLTVSLARVANDFPEVLDDPAIKQLLRSRSGFPHPAVDFNDVDGSVRKRIGGGPGAVVVS